MSTIAQLLSAEHVHCQIDVPSRKRALQYIAKQIEAKEEGQDALFDALMARERLGSTGLGDGVAVPHCRINGTQMHAVFISLAKPVDFEAADAQPVDLLCALIVPEAEQHAHLIALASLAEVFSDPQKCKQLRDCRSNVELHQRIGDLLPHQNPASKIA